MDRLTGRDERGNLLVNGKMVYAGNLYDAASKLEEYEDLEEQLEKTYGECDGLLKTAIKIITEVEKYGVDFEKPNKSRLLTDDDADKWIRWKESDKQGKLIELPCKPGDTVYAFRKNKIVEMVVTTVTIMKNSVMFGWETKEEFAMSPWLWAFEEKDIGTRVFLTEQEAKETLERIDK